MINKIFKERINQKLTEIGVPEPLPERIRATSVLFKLKNAKVMDILTGHVPSPDVLEVLAHEFEVQAEWLTGENDAKMSVRNKRSFQP